MGEFRTSAIPAAAIPAPARQPSEAASIWMAQVLAPVVQNIAGGIGAAVLATIAGWLVKGQTLTPGVLKWGAIVGLIVFGVSMVIRMFGDEIDGAVAAWGSRMDLATRQALLTENARLLEEIENLRSEGLVAHRWGAREAAEKLIIAYYANADPDAQPLTRAASMGRGMTRGDWENGSRLLKAASLLDRGTITAVSDDVALATLARHCATSTHQIRAANGDLVPM